MEVYKINKPTTYKTTALGHSKIICRCNIRPRERSVALSWGWRQRLGVEARTDGLFFAALSGPLAAAPPGRRGCEPQLCPQATPSRGQVVSRGRFKFSSGKGPTGGHTDEATTRQKGRGRAQARLALKACPWPSSEPWAYPVPLPIRAPPPFFSSLRFTARGCPRRCPDSDSDGRRGSRPASPRSTLGDSHGAGTSGPYRQ